MNEKIEAAILKLKADAVGTVFTGFVTNAQVVPRAMLTGEVWRHVLADGFGTFADGHRIETSDISEIHSRGDSLWVKTLTGSEYGILSFAPLGWVYFADLHLAHQRLDPYVSGSPIWHTATPERGSMALPSCERIEPVMKLRRKAEGSRIGSYLDLGKTRGTWTGWRSLLMRRLKRSIGMV